MTAQWIKKAQSGQPVWIGDVRKAFERLEKTGGDCQKISLTVVTVEGKEKSFRFPLPYWTDASEREFIRDYMCASVYNILSALGGREIKFDCDRENEVLRSLVKDIQTAFLPDAAGYGRITREIKRIERLTGEKGAYSLREGNRRTDGEALSAWLKRVSEKSLKGVRAGIDVGGTDIKCIAAVDGELRAYSEYDWNPSAFTAGEQLVEPIIELAEELLRRIGAECFDGIGLSFPDVAVRNRICGGETPKTAGIRECADADYEKEFEKIFSVNEKLEKLCSPEARVRIINDGFAAAFTSAVELAYGNAPQGVEQGIFSHALGTSLGSGWIDENGEFPEIPLEFYDSVIDLGDYPSKTLCREDIRSTLSQEGVHTGVDRYVGQSSAFRYAYEIAPSLLDGYITEENGTVSIRSDGKDLRKVCLEQLMRQAENGNEDAEKVFIQIGEAFARISEEVIFALSPKTNVRYVFGRFVKYPKVFELLEKGFNTVLPEISLVPADSELAYSPLMKQLASMSGITVAQFGQAVGAVYLSEF